MPRSRPPRPNPTSVWTTSGCAWRTWTRPWPSSSAGAPASRWSRAPSVRESGSPSSRRPTTSASSSSSGARSGRVIFLAVLATMLAVPSGYGAGDIDRTPVDFKTPSEIKWVRNAAGTNESAVLFGDPSKPGPYVVRVKWLPGNMSRPHFHPNDRFFETFDPSSTVPAPAGSYVIHYGGKVHYDGAKDEATIIQVWGMGPATSTPAEKR